MGEQLMNLNLEVSEFLNALNLPLDKEIHYLRSLILSSEPNLTENIKWNGPNYCFNGEDRITMRVQAPKMIELIFHRGAKVKEQPLEKLISADFDLLEWKTNDRAVATIKNNNEIDKNKDQLVKIVSLWLKAAN
jgi:hypothetical protein